MAAVTGTDNIFSSLGLVREQETKDGAEDLGLQDFMKLMVTQLNNQDPFQPMENGEFLAQIAQFGSVSGLNQLNDQFTNLASSITSGQALQAGSLVGREVLAPTNTAQLIPGETISGQAYLEGAASEVIVRITDAIGQPVREFSLGAQPAGAVDFSWDGIDNTGNFAPPDYYTVEVTGSRNGVNEALGTQLYATVDSVSLGSQGLILNLNGMGSVAFADIQQIH